MLPKIEQHAQGSYIQTLQSLSKESEDHKVFVLPAGFKSYAQLFYFKKQQPISEAERSAEQIIWGKHGGTVYLIGKKGKYESLNWLPVVEVVSESNGWVTLKVVRE